MAALARDVTRGYGRGDTAIHALRGVDVELPAGGFTAIMGRSGAGKPTLMQCLAGLDVLTSGTIEVAGVALEKLDDTALTIFRRDHLGFVFQTFNLLSMLTAAQNIVLPHGAGSAADGRRPARPPRPGRRRPRPRRPAGAPPQ